MNKNGYENFLSDREILEEIKKDKSELVRNGTLGKFVLARKELYSEGYLITEDPEYYDLTEYTKQLCDSLLNSKRFKKRDSRLHTWFMKEFYDNIGFLTLSFSDKKIQDNSYESMKSKVCEVLNACFEDYTGRAELSKKGRIHFHFICAWNGFVSTIDQYREGKINKLVMNKNDLTQLWYGEKDKNGQPTKYGIYDLVYLPREMNRTESNKVTNYMMKFLYTMESYIMKQDEQDYNDQLDEDLLYKVNNSNTIVARNTPYQQWKKDRKEQDRFIKHQARIFATDFYEKHKYDSPNHFRKWAEDNKGEILTEQGSNGKRLYMIPPDYKTIQVTDYKERKNENELILRQKENQIYERTDEDLRRERILQFVDQIKIIRMQKE